MFVKHYAAVSRHHFSAEERDENRHLKKQLESLTVEDESCQDCTMTELKRAITKMKRKGAEGPDFIPPTFLKELGPIAL